MKEQYVLHCFGHYGEKEEKNCREDCMTCPKEKKEIIFCKKKKTYPCGIMCRYYKLCSDCYWEYFERKKFDERIILREIIEEFMKKNNLKIKEYLYS